MIKFYTNGAGGSPSNGLLPGASVMLDPIKLGRYTHVCKMAFAIQVFKITSGGSPCQRHAGRGCRKSPELGLLAAIRVELKEEFIYDYGLLLR